MIIRLGRMLIRSVAGQAGGANWRTVDNHIAVLKARQPPDVTPGPARGDPYDGLDTTPNTEDGECETWRTIDGHYTAHRKRLSVAWRNTPARPHQSTYDAYMQYAMPHSLRGLTAPDFIPAAGTHLIDIKQYRLNHLTRLQAAEYPPEQLIPNTRRTQLQGLHYAIAARLRGLIDPGPPPVYQYRIIAYIEALDHNRPNAARFWFRTRTRFGLQPDDVGPWNAWNLVDSYDIGMVEETTEIQGLDIDYAPPARLPDGSLADPPGPDIYRLIPLRNLFRQEPIATWPRRQHSVRGTYLPTCQWWNWLLSLLNGGYWYVY